jgi:hypothetical protein
MDVKDVGKRVVIGALSPIPLQQATRAKGTAATNSVPKPEVQLKGANNIPASVSADLRKNLNEAISSLNVASDATTSIANYLSSIDGFIEQAQGEVSPQRKQALESEANQMVDEIKRTAREVSSAASAPIPDDQVRKQVEETIGKTLDVLIPEERGKKDGLQPISFSRKETIIQTITNVAKARARIDDMRKAMQQSNETLKGAVLSYEIAQQNTEASKASVRDVDAAAKLAGAAETKIFSNPATALDAIGDVSPKALDLVKQ